MIFFGWGRKNKQKQVDGTRILICSYGYFSIMFIFMVTMDYKYQLATHGKDGWAYKDISKDTAIELGDGETLLPHWWWRFSLPGAILLILFGSLLSAFVESQSQF